MSKHKFPLACSCGNNVFYHVWNVAVRCNELGEPQGEVPCDPQDRYYCEKCGRMLVEGY